MERYKYTEGERLMMERSAIPFAVYQFINKRVVTLVLSDGFCDLFGYTDRAEAYYVMDNNMYEDTHPDDAVRVAELAFRFATEGGSYEAIYRSKPRGRNEYKIVHAKGEHFYTDTGTRLAVVWYTDEGFYSAEPGNKDNELNRRLNEAMHEESILHANYYDYLTGLPSMTYFFDLAEAGRDSMLRHGKNPVLLFIDLCGMKFYNSKHGFAKGDTLLKAFAELLTSYFSTENCSRFGQDHFAVYTDDEDLDERIRDLFDKWDAIYREESLPVRVGVYMNSMETIDASDACDRAKYACDSVRNTFEHRVVYFDESMLKEAQNRQYIVEHIDEAIAKKWIHVYYQPIVRTANGKVCDEEALARWIDPERGMLSPADFIPILEDAGLIYKLDLYMLDEVIAKMDVMRSKGYHLVPQSINLSRKDFDACDIIEEIRKRVDASGYSRELFTLEITESTVGRDINYMRDQINRFRELGFKVWMDDFGSGYSSLDVLESIEFDLIKFDMHFMQQFDQGEGGKVILTELMKMASGLGVETLCEGVEREDQIDFLREVGSSKMQGFYFDRPISLETLLDKYEKGQEIGFENPEECGYYDSIGGINLYDLAVLSDKDDSDFRHYFNTLPMAIIELKESSSRFVRNNQSFRAFMINSFGLEMSRRYTDFEDLPDGSGKTFMKMIARACEGENRTVIDEILPDKTTVHLFVRRLAVNPVTGTTAFVIAVLTVTDASYGTTYENIARTLASDYFNIFYVNLETEEFIEYSSGVGQQDIIMERHGVDFFESARRDALRLLYEKDSDTFIKSFTKEKVLEAIEEQGSFSLTYRLMLDGNPVYVNMKAVLIKGDADYLTFGVSNVDNQMTQQRTIERLRQEQVLYNRISAILGDFIVMYIIDPDTGRYIESSSTTEYSELGLSQAGEDFFSEALINGEKTIYPDDLPMYFDQITKENIMRRVRRDGLFVLKYHLMINGRPELVKLRAAMVDEQDGEKLFIGVNYIVD